jgi:hypothetical protein
MKKFKTRKEILENPEFKRLAFEFLQEMEILDDDTVEQNVNFFIERKIQQCKMEGGC